MQEKANKRRTLASERKASLRADAAAIRRKVWLSSCVPASEALVETGLELIEALQPSSPVGGYSAIRDELDPLPLLQTLHHKGVAIVLPKMCPGPALIFKQWSPGSPLTIGKFGVYEPGEDQPELVPNVVLVPLLAFDRRGNRLGYGAGFYDRALRKLREGDGVIALGIGFDEQEFPAVPHESLDEPLDMILTPTRVIICGDEHAASVSR